MGLSSSASLSNDVLPIISSSNVNDRHRSSTRIYDILSNMAFPRDLILKTCDRYKDPQDLGKAMEHILSLLNSDEEVDEDGYVKLTEDGEREDCGDIGVNNCASHRRSSSLMNSEVIRFHLECHRESIEEQRRIDEMAEAYEQRRVYREMLRCEELQHTRQCLHALQSQLHAQCQALRTLFLNELALTTHKATDIDRVWIQTEFERQMVALQTSYMQQKTFLDENVRRLLRLLGDAHGEVDDLRQLDLDEVPEFIPTSAALDGEGSV